MNSDHAQLAGGSNVHPADHLIELVERMAAPVCVGLDPVLERMPTSLQPRERSLAGSAAAVQRFCEGVVEAVAGIVPCVKFQSACFERFGSAGVAALEHSIVRAKRAGLCVILDAKRGDIGISAAHYAAAATEAFRAEGAPGPDWITVHSYLGSDGIEPFLDAGLGTFALVRTSNPSGDALQSLELASGATVADAVAREVAQIGEKYVGKRGLSTLGAVVGATKRADAARLRELMPRQVFLVPGYGAQGGGVDDVLPCFLPGGRGAIVTASRSVIYASDPNDPSWPQRITEAASRFADEIGKAVGLR